MFGTTGTFKIQFFNRDVFSKKYNWERLNRGPLFKAGGLIRKISRQSIKRRKRQPFGKKSKEKPSRIGTPPHSRSPGKPPPMKQIFNKPYGVAGEIIGMVGYGKQPGDTLPIPGLHEHGGSGVRTVFVETHRTLRKGKRKRRQSKYVIHKKRVTKRVIYPPRPFMLPALMKVKSRLPAMWANSIQRLKGVA